MSPVAIWSKFNYSLNGRNLFNERQLRLSSAWIMDEGFSRRWSTEYNLHRQNVYWRFVIDIAYAMRNVRMDGCFWSMCEWDRYHLPVLINNPSPSHGWKNRYSDDLSMYTWLLRIISTSAGLKRNTSNFGPIHILLIESKSKARLFSTTVRKTSEKISIMKIMFIWRTVVGNNKLLLRITKRMHSNP